MAEYKFQIEYANNQSKEDMRAIEEAIDGVADSITKELFECVSDKKFEFKLPTIILDDSHPTNEHYDGDLSSDDVRDALISLLSEYPDIDSRLRKEILSFENYKETPGVIFEIIIGIRRTIIPDILFNPLASPAEKEFARRAAGIIIRLKTEDSVLTSVLGRYYPETNDIFLYYNNLGYTPRFKSDQHKESFFAKIVMTLAHEMFHAFHYSLAGDLFLSSGEHPEIVKEASADFFSVFYCLAVYMKHLKSILALKEEASHRYYEWIEWFISKWPYSKALYYLRLKGKEPLDANNHFPEDYNDYDQYGSIEKLRKVIHLSKTNMDDAYHALVYDYDFDDFFIPYIEELGKESRDLKRNRDPDNSPSGRIVEFSIIRYPGTWGFNRPPVRYTIKESECTINEIHYKSNGLFDINLTEDSHITIEADPDLTRTFFEIVNALNWSKDYREQALDAGSWDVTLTYSNQTQKIVKGTVPSAPDGAKQLTTLFKKMYAIAGCQNDPYIF